MTNSSIQLSIVGESALVVHGIKNHVKEQFGEMLDISCFVDFRNCLKKVRLGCDLLVVIDTELDGKKASEVLLSAKLVNDSTKGVVCDSATDVSSTLIHFMSTLPKAAGHDATH